MTQPKAERSTQYSVSAGIPAELRARKQWLGWRYTNGTKKPVNGGSSTNPATWMTFDEALYVTQFVKDGEGGIGFVPTADDPYTFIDLDGCIVDGEIVPEAQAIVDRLDTYCEISPSGTGLRQILLGALPADTGHVGEAPWAGRVPHTKAQIEAYDRGHYFALTGNGSGDIASRQTELDAFAAKYLTARAVAASADVDWDRPAPAEADDAIVLAQMREDRRFSAVFDGSTVPAGKDGDSDADFELCCRLAEIVGNEPRWIERLWGASALARRDKFDRDDYRTKTIERAIAAADFSSSSSRKAKDEEDDFSSSRRLYKAKKNIRVRSDGGRPRVRGGSTHGGLRRAGR